LSVRFNDISVKYGNLIALNSINLDIESSAVGLLGPNGAGKTTFIKTLLGLVSPQNGTGEVLGLDIRTQKLGIRQKVGYVPENDCYISGMTGIRFVTYMGRICGMPRKDAIQRAHEILQYVGMDEERYRLIDTYSTGMKQRIKLAQALIHDPELLLLDEPTVGMDPKGRQEMLDLIKDISSLKSIKIIVSSHLLPDIEYTCQDVIVLREGKVIVHGNINELKSSNLKMYEVRIKGNEDAFISELAGLDIECSKTENNMLRISLPDNMATELLFSIAHNKGTQIRHLVPTKYSLEDVFTQAIGGE